MQESFSINNTDVNNYDICNALIRAHQIHNVGMGPRIRSLEGLIRTLKRIIRHSVRNNVQVFYFGKEPENYVDTNVNEHERAYVIGVLKSYNAITLKELQEKLEENEYLIDSFKYTDNRTNAFLRSIKNPYDL